MKTRLAAALSRCRTFLRHWLRFTWLSRLPLAGPRPWRRAARPRRRAGEPPTTFRPSLETLESRWTPDDLLGAASAPVAVGGLVLLAGSHTTPLRLMFDHTPPADTPALPPDTPATPATPDPDAGAEDLFASGVLDEFAFLTARNPLADEEYVSVSARDAAADELPLFTSLTDADETVDPLSGAASAGQGQPPSPLSTAPPAATDSAAKYAGGGSGPGGSCTPNAGLGGGGPTGGGEANLHLPNQNQLQQNSSGNNVAAGNAASNPPANAATTSDTVSAASAHNTALSNAVLVMSPATATASSQLADNRSNPVRSSASASAVLPASTLSLRSSAASAVSGQLVTFTATVRSSVKSATPTGKVVFTDGGATLGNASLHNGTAALSTSTLPVGSYEVRAAYQGNSSFAASANTQSQTVQPDSTTVTLRANPAAASGQAVTFTASVSALAPGSGTPTGTIDFQNGRVDLGSAKLNNGVATLTASSLTVSSGGVTAIYQGDSQFRGSQNAITVSAQPSETSPDSSTGSGASMGGSSQGTSGSQTGASDNSGNTASAPGSGSRQILASPMTASGGGSGITVVPSYSDATLSPILATEGQAYRGTIIDKISDPDSYTQYSEVIDWGDGSQTGFISIGSASAPLPVLTHTYTLAGSYFVTDQLYADRDGQVWLGGTQGGIGLTLSNIEFRTNAVVVPAPLHADDLSVSLGHTLSSATVATFVVPGGKAGNYTATVDWGDGSGPQQASVVALGNGTFAVQASHVYAHPGSFLTDVRVIDLPDPNAEKTGVTQDGAGTITVVPPAVPPDLVFTTVGVQMYQQDDNSVALATFTVGDTALSGDAFAATIDWGDGTMPTLGVVQGSDGSYIVTGTHFYAHPGQYLLTVNVVSPMDTVLGWGTAHVTTPTVDLMTSTPVIPIDDSGNMLLASFADPNPTLTAADFRAVVDWGNGNGPQWATVSGTAGTFWVSAIPVYAIAGVYDARLLIEDSNGDVLAAVNESFTITNLGAGYDDYAACLDPAWFRLVSPSNWQDLPYGDLFATIDWGDGTSDPQDSDPPGVIEVERSKSIALIVLEDVPDGRGHVYQSEGTYTQQVNLLMSTSVSGHSTTTGLASAEQNIRVADAPLLKNTSPLPGTVHLTAGVAFSALNVAGFVDENLNAAADDYTATIDWGDGTTSQGTIVLYHAANTAASQPATFAVEGSHLYSDAGDYAVSVLIQEDIGGANLVTFTDLKVGPSPPPPPPPPLPLTVSAQVRNDDPDRAMLLPSGEATVDLNMGAVRISQTLDFDASPGVTVGGSPALVYNSATAHGEPILQVTLTSTAAPTNVALTVAWEGTTLAPIDWTPPSNQTGPKYVIDVPITQTLTGSGVYDFTIKASGEVGGVLHAGTLSVTGQASVVVNTASPYGAGWGLQSTTRLVSDLNGDMLMIDGAGDAQLFTLNSNGTFTSPAGDFGTLTGGLALGYYLYTDQYQDKYYYDLNRRLTQIVQPNTWTTLYNYSGGLLSSVTAPDGGVTNLNYDNGLLSSIDEPGSRVVSLSIAGSGGIGNLTEISDAAGYTRLMSYDGKHLLTVDQWAPYDSTFDYSTLGLLDSLSQSPVNSTFTSANSALLVNSNGQPLARMVDGVGDTTTYLLDNRGRELEEIQPSGTSESWQLDASGAPTEYTDFDGLVTYYAYDNSGDLTQVDYPNGTSENNEYDSYFHNLTQSVDPDGDTTEYEYDGESELISETIGYSTPQAATTQYSWSDGLIQTMTDPDGNETVYKYSGFLETSQTLYNASSVAVSSAEFSYDAAGNPKAMVDSDGGTTQYQYDGDNNLTLTIDPDGITTSQGFTAAGFVKSTTDGRGIEDDYYYDAAGLETAEVDAANSGQAETTTQNYNAASEETSTMDADGNVTDFAYDRDGNLTLMVQGAGTPQAASTSSAYDPDGNLTQSVDPDGDVSHYYYDAVGNETLEIDGYGTPSASTTSTVYDGDGNVLEVIDGYGTSDAEETSYAYDPDGNQISSVNGDGDSTISKYDGDGNLTASIDPDGNTSEFFYDAQGDQTESIQGYGTPQQAESFDYYDGDGNETLSIDADGNTSSYLYDADGNNTLMIEGVGSNAISSTSMAYDADGNQTLVVTGDGTSAAESMYSGYDANNNQTLSISGYGSVNAETTVSAYDGDNNLTQEVDGDGNVSDFYYDSLGDQTESITAAGTSSAAISYDYYDGDGNLTLSLDADGNSTVYQYDAVGNQTLVVAGAGSSVASSNHYAYDAAGNQTKEIDADGNTTLYLYDAAGNQTESISGYGTDNAETAKWLYDADGNVTQQVDASGDTSTFRYDPLGNQTQVVTGVGTSSASTSSLFYDGNGNETLSVDGAGDSTLYAYDADGNQTLEIDGYNSSSAATIRYAYDASGNETEEIDADGNTTNYLYDANGNQTAVVNPLGDTTSYQYDGDNNMIAQINANGTSIDWTYDSQGQVLTETQYNANGTVEDTDNYSYDADGNLLTASNSYGTYVYSYDAVGDMVTEVDPFGLTLNYGYDGNGNVTSEIDSLGGTTNYTYDANGNVSSIQFSDSTAQARLDLTYTGDNQVSTLTRYADTAGTELVGSSSYSYDASGNETEILDTNSSDGVLAEYQYSYDADNRLSSEVDTENGGSPVTTTYGYNATSELTSVNGTEYSYDANGNPTDSGDEIGTGNELLSDGTWDYSYDADGNTIKQVNIATGEYWTYSWNASNQMTEASDYEANGTLIQSVTYQYDVFGNLIEEDTYTASNQQTTVAKYAYDASGNIWADLNGSNQLVDRRLFVSINGQTQPFVRIDSSGNVAWYLTDHLGSVRMLIDNTGTVLDQIDYDAFGNITNETDPANGDRYKFASMQYNAVTGLYDDDARDENPEDNRFESSDPTGLAAGPNPYDYVGNDPTNAIDPTGLDSVRINGGKLSISTSRQFLPTHSVAGIEIEFTSDKDTLPKGYLKVKQWMQIEVYAVYSNEGKELLMPLPPDISLDPKEKKGAGNKKDDHGHHHDTSTLDNPAYVVDHGRDPKAEFSAGIYEVSKDGKAQSYNDYPTAAVALHARAEQIVNDGMWQRNRFDKEITVGGRKWQQKSVMVVQRFYTVVYLGGKPVRTIQWISWGNISSMSGTHTRILRENTGEVLPPRIIKP